MKNILLVAIVFCLFITPSCKKKGNDNGNGKVYNSVNDIAVPSGFNWENSRTIPVYISITDPRFSTAHHTISIYDGDPFAGGKLMARGSASTANAFSVNLYLPKVMSEVYVLKSSPDHSMILQKVALGSSLTMSIGATDPNFDAKPAAHRDLTPLDDCNTGCTNTITTNTSNLNVSEGQVICITGSNITVGFSNVTGGTIRVCGTNVTLQNLNMGGYTNLLVLAGGSINVSGLNYNNASVRIINYGTITGLFTVGGYLDNYGTFNCTGDLNFNSTAQTFNNNGIINVSGNFNNSSALVATNNATLNISGNFNHNSGTAAFMNYCAMNINGNMNLNSLVKNHSFIKVAGTTTINSGGELTMHNGAMFKTNNFILDNSHVTGYGSTSLLKITGTVNIMNTGALLTGMLQVCAPTAVPAARLSAGAANDCSLYIPVTSCYMEGNGGVSVPDVDGDGVADANDEYPTDATKAYNNYYPSSTGGSTVAFEDNWPSKGDYDLNDVVVGYRYQVVTNAGNNVVKVIGNYTLLATGGELGNGFGVQFPVNAANVSNVTGATLEAGQTKAVVILFSDMRTQMTNWNTYYGATASPTVNYAVSFDVAGSTSISSFGLNPYNPFIWNYGLGNNRGREIHLAGHAPTDLGYTSYFGTADDNSSAAANRYFVTTTGLPYAIDVPVNPFNYPVEMKDITQAYLHIGQWAESGGTSYTDWYSNTAADYRNTTNLYNH